MSSTSIPTGTSTSASASSTASSCGAILYNIPVKDAACAMPYGGNHTDIMSKCCDSADVVAYADNCGLYCLAQGQTADDLTSCLFQNGAPWADVFCNAVGNATANATASDAPLSSGASVVAGTGASGTKSAGASATGSSNSTNAAPAMGPGGLGLGLTTMSVSALLLSSVLLGALQL